MRPRSDLGRPSRHRDRAGGNVCRCGALRGRHAAEATAAAYSRRHAAARHPPRREGAGALRRRDVERGPDGPGRRPRRDPGREAAAQAAYHLRDVRKAGRTNKTDGGTMNHMMGLAIESLVALLLIWTIAYCRLLNKRLKILKADEQSLKATISELITATEIAERAIGGLKVTVRECDENLGAQLSAASDLSGTLGKQIAVGSEILKRLCDIAVAAAAQAFSERRRGLAA